MKFLFINANLYGHINPTLGFVKQLTQYGVQVDYFCSKSFSEQVNHAGGKWIGYHDQLDQFFKEYRPTDRHPFYMLMEYILLYDEVVLPVVLDLIEKTQYDMILCDSIFGAGVFLQQLTKIPVVCSHSSFAMSHAPVPKRMLEEGFHPQLDYCFQILRRICKEYSVEQPSLEQIFISKGNMNIVYTTESFNGDEHIHEPEYLFLGPSIDRVQDRKGVNLSNLSERKLVYISLGSVNTKFLDFYRKCITAFQDTEYYVFMSIGKKCDISELGEIPSNFYVRNYLPQLDILKKADVFINHAGFNSVNEALFYGVPMLAFPLVNDQPMVGKRLESMQLGIVETTMDLSPEEIKLKVETIISDQKIKDHCKQISKEMKECRDHNQSKDILLNYITSWKERNHNGIEE